LGSLQGRGWPLWVLSLGGVLHVTRTNDLNFFAEGIPRPQGSKRYLGNGRFVEASDVKPWRATIANAVFTEWVRTGDDSAFEGPVKVTAVFYMPKPKTVKRLLPSVAPDLDKLQRGLGDALSVDCKALADDSLIVEWSSAKVYCSPGEVPGVRVNVTAL
jgi:Holliday junction resolvase RusA-like endonuclease